MAMTSVQKKSTTKTSTSKTLTSQHFSKKSQRRLRYDDIRPGDRRIFNGYEVSPKEALLSSLRGNGRYRYSRYNGLPLRYAGGKSLAVGYILEQLPENIKSMTSPFFGGGSTEFACANELGIKVHGYDIFDILTNYWETQLSNPAALANRIQQWQPDKETYKTVKQRLKLHWNQDNLITDKLELAAHYWFNHNLSYGPGFLGWMSSIYQDENRFKRLLSKVRDFRSPNTTVRAGSFEETIPAHKREFLYCDPPYYLDGDSRMFKGIYPQRNFPVHHKNFDHEKLRDILLNHSGGFILSYNDCQTIRDWYKDFQIIKVVWQYTLGQGETRIGKNRIENGDNHIKKSHELLIVRKN